jgi:hypothetical protein
MRFVSSLISRQFPGIHSLSDSTDRRRWRIRESGEVGFSELIRAALCAVSEFRNSLDCARRKTGTNLIGQVSRCGCCYRNGRGDRACCPFTLILRRGRSIGRMRNLRSGRDVPEEKEDQGEKRYHQQ